MVFKGIAEALGYIPKEELETALKSLSERKTELEAFKAGKQGEIELLQEKIARLEEENTANQSLLKKLTGDIENVSKQYSQTQEDFRISEENSKKTQELIEEHEKGLESRCADLEKKCDSLEKDKNGLLGQLSIAQSQLRGSQKTRGYLEKEFKKLKEKLKSTESSHKTALKLVGKHKAMHKKLEKKHRTLQKKLGQKQKKPGQAGKTVQKKPEQVSKKKKK